MLNVCKSPSQLNHHSTQVSVHRKLILSIDFLLLKTFLVAQLNLDKNLRVTICSMHLVNRHINNTQNSSDSVLLAAISSGEIIVNKLPGFIT